MKGGSQPGRTFVKKETYAKYTECADKLMTRTGGVFSRAEFQQYFGREYRKVRATLNRYEISIPAPYDSRAGKRKVKPYRKPSGGYDPDGVSAFCRGMLEDTVDTIQGNIMRCQQEQDEARDWLYSNFADHIMRYIDLEPVAVIEALCPGKKDEA